MNKEIPFLRALQDVLKGITIEYATGGSEPFVDVAIGGKPGTVGYPVAAIIPLGPQFLTEVLGGQAMTRKTRFVGVTLELHYEHIDKETGILNMSDILWAVVNGILQYPNLGDAESVELGDIDYAYSIDDENQNEIPEWGYKGVALLPIYATYKYT